jgi:hypothetical protein
LSNRMISYSNRYPRALSGTWNTKKGMITLAQTIRDYIQRNNTNYVPRTWGGVNGFRKQKLRSNGVLLFRIEWEIDLLRVIPPFRKGIGSNSSGRLRRALRACSTLVLCSLIVDDAPLFARRWCHGHASEEGAQHIDDRQATSEKTKRKGKSSRSSSTSARRGKRGVSRKVGSSKKRVGSSKKRGVSRKARSSTQLLFFLFFQTFSFLCGNLRVL